MEKKETWKNVRRWIGLEVNDEFEQKLALSFKARGLKKILQRIAELWS